MGGSFFFFFSVPDFYYSSRQRYPNFPFSPGLFLAFLVFFFGRESFGREREGWGRIWLCRIGSSFFCFFFVFGGSFLAGEGEEKKTGISLVIPYVSSKDLFDFFFPPGFCLGGDLKIPWLCFGAQQTGEI